MSESWRFSIDVGGTFTDCLAVSPQGEEHFTKVLSSGLTKGTIEQVTGTDRFIDSQRSGTIDRFWNGATIHFIGPQGDSLSTATVTHFDANTGEFRLDRELPAKVPLARYELDGGLQAPVLAIHLVQQVPIQSPLGDCRVDLGTTRGTNALLTRKGAPTALITSRGLRDFLAIGDQARPKLFELTVRKPKPLFEAAVEINERILHDGAVEQRPSETEIREKLLQLKQQGFESIAVCLMHSFRFSEHEQLVGRIRAEVGFSSIRLSSNVAPLIKLVPRGETTVLDAYLNPVIGTYLDEVQSQLSPDSQLRFMTSGGGLVSRARFSGKDSVLSGPAGGVVGAARIAKQAGFQKVIGFDMGGTSTDVSRFDGSFPRSFETVKAGVRIVTPMLEVETVAAGGGSVCWFDGTKLRVGPDSAGADPGPACYGRGGPLTITDVNLYLGRIQRDLFPFELDFESVERRVESLVADLQQAGFDYQPHDLAEGFLQIANQNMSAAIQTVSVARGYDPRDYLLMSFGGAGSQHCCAVADHLGMDRILDHPQSSILSAVGIRLADQTAHAVSAILQTLDGKLTESLSAEFEKLTRQVTAALVDEGNPVEEIQIQRSLDLRYQGTEPFFSIPQPADSNFATAFARQHQQHYGYVQDRPIEIVAARVDGVVRGNRMEPIPMPEKFVPVVADATQPVWNAGRFVDAGSFARPELAAGTRVTGPAIIADQHTTTIVDPDWEARVLEGGVILLQRSTNREDPGLRLAPAALQTPDPVQLEIFNNHFSSIAREMGVALQKTSVSVNVKERLDFSCAIFTRTGDLVVNAPHIPVHLGAMSETVRTTIQLNPDVRAGDVFVTNDPYAGGSHLPDVTVITPVFDVANGTELLFWVASRSHHAEIGGAAPGSMPAGAKTLGEEGVLIQNFRLIEGGSAGRDSTDRFDGVLEILRGGDFPSRSPAENIADLRAQVAANRRGLSLLLELVDKYSFPLVDAYMGFIQSAAEQKVRAALRQIPDGVYRFSDSMDNGATIHVALSKQDDQLDIDFAGTDPVTPDNLNANRAIVCAATMYVMRLLINEEIPLNEGVMNPVSIRLPVCFLNPTPADDPRQSPAIVGGNVETSQRVVDVLLGALKIAAASQGTMNNWLMGGASFGYYETIGGGAGATLAGPGADAVHTHMTNTRLTDPEVLETRYPVVLREFSIRSGSGGAGNYRGGDGIIRELEFCEPLTVSLLTSRRNCQPYGLSGGSPGASGVNLLIRNGTAESLPSRCEIDVKPGDRLRVETPGGGGAGRG